MKMFALILTSFFFSLRSCTNICQGRKAEEQRAQRLASEYGQFRHDAERRLAEKDEEVEAIRYVCF